MCGIFGEFSIDKQLIEKNHFLKLNQLSLKRGPDRNGYYSDNFNIQFGFNRLSILDPTEAGRQPMQSADGRWLLVFNGEIYNHLELRKRVDYSWRGHADSETILAGLTHWGFEETISNSNGMFAIAAFDKLEQTLWLARDFAGIKPLFYGGYEKGVVFASQFNQVYLHPLFRSRLQLIPEEVKAYFALGYMQAPGTIYGDIFQVEPGQIVKFKKNIWKPQKKYFKQWEALKGIEKMPETHPESVKAFESVFADTIKDQLVADVPLAVFLSGGIDSPLVAAWAKKLKPDIVAYTIGVDDPQLDETDAAVRYARAIGIRHRVKHFRQSELLTILDDHFNALSEPFADYSSLPTYLVTKIASEENKVMLSGDGGDELFWGYPRFLNTVKHFPWFHYPRFLRRLPAAILRRNDKQVSYGVSAFDKIGDWVLNQHVHQNGGLVSEVFKNVDFPFHLTAVYEPPSSLRTKEELLRFLRWNEFYAHMQRVLAKVDRASMGNSLEARVPFLDKRVIDFAWKLKPGLGIQHQTPKYLLKKALANAVGEKNVTQLKKGFGVPIRHWLQHELREEVEDLLLGSDIYGSDFINIKPLQKVVEDFLRHDQGNEWGIWIMYAWQKWAIQYFEPTCAASSVK